MMSLLLIPLMGFTGLVVDVGSWYANASRLHRAADAASLAGVVWLPDITTATAVALEVAERNGYDNADPDISVTVTQTGPAELEVTVTDSEIELYFSSLFLDNVDISRSATAEFVKSIPMGNPENYLGTDPERGISEQNYLSISGATTGKKGGDRFASKDCDADLCTPGDLGNLEVNGGEFREDGYLFSVRVDSVQPYPLVIEAFDPGYYEGSQQCNNHGNFPNGYDFNGLLSGGLAAMFPGDGATDPDRVAHWAERYANAPGAIYCTGDTPSSGVGSVTSFYVREPDATPFNDLDNPIIYSGQCSPEQYDAYDEDFYALLEQVGSDPRADTFAAEFRRWVRFCEIPVGSVETGDYIVQVRTNASPGQPTMYDPTYYLGGRNHYSLRAGWDTGGSFPDGTDVELFANGHMAIDVNVPAASTTMELARINEAYQGRSIAIELWDVADASNPGTLTILPPVESVGYGVSFTNCSITNTKTTWTDPDPTDCAAPVSNSNMNGRLLTITVVIPAGYDCDEHLDTGCYLRVNVDFPVGTQVYDHTTWSIRVIGDPIRLLE